MNTKMSITSFVIIGLGCAVSYYMFGPVGLGVLALFILLKHGA